MINLAPKTWRALAVPLVAFLLGGAIVAGWQSWGQAPTAEPHIIALPPPSVQVAKPERRTVVRSIELPGDVSAYHQARLYAKVAGYLEKVLADKGDSVTAGQLLAVIQAPELEREVQQSKDASRAATARIAAARGELELHHKTYLRLKGVFDEDPGLLARQELDIAEAKAKEASAKLALAEAKLKAAQQAARRAADMQAYTEIRAPFAGTVSQRFLDPGTLMQSATSSAQGATRPVLELVNDGTVRISVQVPEAEVSKVQPGSEATVRPEAHPDLEIPSRITRMAGSLDTATRTLLAEIELANAEHRLKPGMFVKVILTLESHADALVVPTSAVVIEKDKRAVFVVRDGKAEKLVVKTGFEGPDWTEIVGGLAGEEAVVVNGKEDVSRGGTVQIIPGAGGS